MDNDPLRTISLHKLINSIFLICNQSVNINETLFGKNLTLLVKHIGQRSRVLAHMIIKEYESAVMLITDHSV